jgi:flavin reductase (DIM6/NTAB) family NADH-FMN oxidoreductase RutF
MHASSASLAPDVDEFAHAGLAGEPSRLVKPPRVVGSPIALECRHYRTLELPHDDPAGRNALVLGTVVGVYIEDRVLVEGRIDLSLIKPIARLGYLDYARVDTVFSMGGRPR